MPAWQRQLEARLLVGLRHAADVAAVQLGDVTSEGEPEPVPGERDPGLGAAVETLEQMFRLAAGDPRPGAGDRQADRRAVSLHHDSRGAAGRRELARVVEQVLDRDSEQRL